MRVGVVTIGDELLIGQTVNTNASWMGQQLTDIGADVAICLVIQDVETEITEALDLLMPKVDVVILSGGLGPTNDDITKLTLAKYFNAPLEINEGVLARVKGFFDARSREMLEVNIQQAAMPKGCVVLDNLVGTASGMWFDNQEKVIISLPGVPYEMKYIMTNSVLPKLVSQFDVQKVYKKTIYFQGIGESYIADEIQDLEKELDSQNIKIAYLPKPGLVRMRFNSADTNENRTIIDSAVENIKSRFKDFLYSTNEESLSKVVGDLLLQNSFSVGTVESLTSGGIAGFLVDSPGASGYFKGSLLTYTDEMKVTLANVKKESLRESTAVSENVAKEMAENGRKVLGVDFCISSTGYADNPNSDPEIKAGLVFIGVAGPQGVKVYRFQFGDNRSRNIRTSVLSAVNLLHKMVKETIL